MANALSGFAAPSGRHANDAVSFRRQTLSPNRKSSELTQRRAWRRFVCRPREATLELIELLVFPMHGACCKSVVVSLVTAALQAATAT